MPQYKYHHVHFISPNPLEAAAFYEQAFHAKRVSLTKYPDGGTRVELNIEGTTIIIRSKGYKDKMTTDNPQKRYGLEHFGLFTDNIEATVAHLKKMGATFVQYDTHIIKWVNEIGTLLPGDPGGTKIAFVLAPDNVLIELTQHANR